MTAMNLLELEALAKTRLETGAFGYIRGGAEDEVTLRENRRAFERLRLLPRYLVDVSTIDTRTSVLGIDLEAPILLAPVAFQVLAHPDGELASARAAAESGVGFVASTLSSHPMDAIARASDGPKWFQLYCAKDQAFTDDMVARAEDLGYRALAITVDVPVAGGREADERNGFHLPPAAFPGNFAGHANGNLDAELDRSKHEGTRSDSALVRLVDDIFDPSLDWRVIERVKRRTKLPVLIKGILTVEDAALAIDHGADGIVVSNHGGRQLDSAPSSIEMLPEVAEHVDGRVPILLDSGIRRGSDVVKAVALGATAVLVGRPMVFGLAIDGEAGVRHMLRLLRDEIERCMALCGRASLAALDRDMVRPGSF